jgi:hypothetical protein
LRRIILINISTYSGCLATCGFGNWKRGMGTMWIMNRQGMILRRYQ